MANGKLFYRTDETGRDEIVNASVVQAHYLYHNKRGNVEPGFEVGPVEEQALALTVAGLGDWQAVN